MGLLLALLAGLYLRSVTAEPVFDDAPQLALVGNYTTWRQAWGLDSFHMFRPVKNLVFLALSRLAPGRYAVWHGFSMLLAAAGVLLSARYLLLLCPARTVVLAATAWFWLSPVMVSSISWLSAVNILVMLAAGLGCLIAAERSLDARPPRAGLWLAASQALLFLAQLSYQAAVALPALLVVHDAYRDPRRLRRASSWLRYGLFAVTTALYLVLRHAMGGGTRMENDAIVPLPAWQLSLSAPVFFMHHLLLWFRPFGRQYVLATYDIGAPGAVLRIVLAWAAVAVLAAAGWCCRRKWPAVTFGLAWFAAALLPLCNVVPLFNGPVADYYLALPALGLSFLAANIAARLAAPRAPRGPRLAALVGLGLWSVALVATTAHWITAWNSGEHMLERSLAARPDSFKARAGLARIRAEAGRIDDALRLARETVRMAPGYLPGYYALFDAANRGGRYEEALDALARARERDPQAVAPLVLTGHLHMSRRNDPDAAEKHFLAALALPWDPEQSPVAVFSLGKHYAARQQWREAVEVWEHGRRRMPRHPDCHNNLALGYLKLGHPQRALGHAHNAAALGAPVHPGIRAMIDTALHAAASLKDTGTR